MGGGGETTYPEKLFSDFPISLIYELEPYVYQKKGLCQISRSLDKKNDRYFLGVIGYRFFID